MVLPGSKVVSYEIGEDAMPPVQRLRIVIASGNSFRASFHGCKDDSEY